MTRIKSLTCLTTAIGHWVDIPLRQAVNIKLISLALTFHIFSGASREQFLMTRYLAFGLSQHGLFI